MEELGMRVPADAAALHRTCRADCFGEPCPETYVECKAVEMLTIFGDPERGALEHRVGLGGPIGGEDGCALRVDCIHRCGEKIDDPHVNSNHRPGIVGGRDSLRLFPSVNYLTHLTHFLK